MKSKAELISDIRVELDTYEAAYDSHTRQCNRCLGSEDCQFAQNILFEIYACEDEIAELA